MWARYMAIAFVTNGLGIYGLRFLAGTGIRGSHNLAYLFMWYLFGCMVAGLAYFIRNRRPTRSEVVITAGMAVCSILGQLGMVLSMDHGLPGFVVFPVAVGGGMLLVLLAALFFFGERPGMLGLLGIGLGMAALVLLAIG
jgi:multidrug transporter EmrE-like cation transporter